MSAVSTIGLDLAKNVFQFHCSDVSGTVTLRKKPRRDQVPKFFATQPACTVAMEACASSHHWGREIAKLGHQIRLIAPAYVKPFVKRQKNDAADAEAICEAAQRPTMRFVLIKTEEQQGRQSYFVLAIFWSVSELRSLMQCEAIWPSSGASSQRVPVTSPSS